MFNTIMVKITAVFAVISGVFFAIIRYQSKKNNELEHEIETVEKKASIQLADSTFKAQVVADEQEYVLNQSKEAKKNERPSIDVINRM